ncbi:MULTISPECIES: penicillin-binding protein 2 [unclassified Pseudonocardia]|uniref:peptidoglycan D,D-transpeptidase FtsI family protein n=1 Tax=unclassified Pseudonocardia TaxID=2619320 RepID=UPI0006CB6E33|nr:MULTISPECIES: penicillin-binding protein 2 [unclassified Pseudonocardia]ALE75486.1 penicillin-binding protein [Pseudonocardia sp. EC080625-04]ALL74860.1 penicillin-binding protein [Pseudonocardia sp. EC080610-09]ALL81883.1 penicillin-binding protein [Pseudonocardia sp. EC080619-01]OLM15754.1 Cell division protein FtsI [Peptidoglycan synthetase] [Pseudonocardia sp. Ae707_Ps1]OLM21563.1 Cell division protein FtsI [Peptidoglycan synthetase] [Pseudonocardia sp. Ae707_Ps1]
MNRPVRRVALAVMVMIVALLANITYVQVVVAGQYRDDPRNQRSQIDEYSRQRGQITAGGQVLAQSVDSDGRLRYARQYPEGPAFAPITGFLSTVYGKGALERSTDDVLNGTDDRLFVRRLSDLITGRDPAGGNVVTTVDPDVQRVAYDGLQSRGYTGAVVALEPQTGNILAMASTPSYDPNRLAAPDAAEQQAAWREYNNAELNPLTNRAINEIEPPGSTFKLVTTAAALQNGYTPESRLTAARNIQLADSTTTLENYNGSQCGGGDTASLREALARSCNTAFAQLGQELGADKLRAQAEAFGIGRSDLQIPMPVTASQVGPMSDVPSTQQSAIGQRDVRLTPMQLAMIGGSIANGGQTMAPHLIKEIQGATLDVVDTTEPDRMARSMPGDVARTLTDLMIGSEDRTQGGGKITGVQIASKTGTAEHGTDPKNTPPHAWYVAFAPADNPRVAVAVLVESGGDRGAEATGGSVAAPIGRAVIAETLRDAQ